MTAGSIQTGRAASVTEINSVASNKADIRSVHASTGSCQRHVRHAFQINIDALDTGLTLSKAIK